MKKNLSKTILILSIPFVLFGVVVISLPSTHVVHETSAKALSDQNEG